jgi:hypothetical protein
VRPSRAVALVGVAGNLAALGGWALAKTSGIGFVAGLDFAALEGVGGGQIKEGEERLCDHAHGA